MRARAWTEPVVDENADLRPRETPRVAARLTQTASPRLLNEKVRQTLGIE